MNGGLAFLLMGLLLTGSFISQMGVVLADSDSDKPKQDKEKNKSILEFAGSSVLVTSSTTTVCHIPPGNPGNQHVIVVGTSSLTAHLKHGDNQGQCLAEESLVEFSLGIVETDSKTLTEAIDFMENIIIDTSSDSKLGPAVSEAAQLHKLFAHEDKEIKKQFQKIFLEFIKIIKEKIGKEQGLGNKSALNELGKAQIKIQSDIDKEEKEEKIKEKIQLALELKNEKEKLQEIRNKIALAKINHDTDNPNYEDLLVDEGKHLGNVLIAEAKSNGEGLTEEKINEITEKISEVKVNHKTNSEERGSDQEKGQGSGNSSHKNNDSKGKEKSNGKSNGKSKNK